MRDQIAYLREQARKCRWLAGGLGDDIASQNLLAMATEYEERANQLERDAREKPEQ
jgi:hypothetical protein